MPLVIVPVLIALAVVALIPVSLVQRYRMGTSRQRARGWLVTINLAAVSLSLVMFLITALMTSIWIHPALIYTIAGTTAGFALGGFGLWLTRWEPVRGVLHYTPNRWLVLVMTLVVTARVLFGFWRAWHTWRAGLDDAAWIAAVGVAQSMAAGAVVLGYYFVYWLGVRRRLKHHAWPQRSRRR